jgi:replication-associated recombination protein RarA
MKNKLFWEKWRPSTLDDIILLPRIRKSIENGLSKNIILYGTSGIGKTTLSKILSNGKPCLSINTSMETSIDTLRSKIEEFCSTMSMFDSADDTKVVFLDEFEGASRQFQEAFKGFIEKHTTVRFIATTNNLSKIIDPLHSRFLIIDFNAQSLEEEKFLKTQMYKRIMEVICPAEDITISKDDLVKLINKYFPDFRAILVQLQNFKETGELSSTGSNIDLKLRMQLYDMVFSNDTPEQVYHFLMTNFGADKIDEMIRLMGKPFIQWIFENKKPFVDKIFKVSRLVTEHTTFLENSGTDPIIVGLSLFGEVKALNQ